MTAKLLLMKKERLVLKPKDVETTSCFTHYPIVDAEKCNLCGKCGDFCRFNAIIPSRKKVLVFEESCHDCGGCEIICDCKAITYEKREIGNIFLGKTFFNSPMKYGKLNIGEMSGVKIIKDIYSKTKESDFIIDCPPGTSCTTVAAVEVADFAVIVTEPSPFGLSDMKLVVELLRDLKIPFGIIINKSLGDDREILNFALENKISILGKIPFDKDIAKNYAILGKIPFDKDIAKNYAKGEVLSHISPKYKEIFENILNEVKKYEI